VSADGFLLQRAEPDRNFVFKSDDAYRQLHLRGGELIHIAF
jgi:hypothetical protein